MLFTNIWELLKDMRLHGSGNIICADSPPYYGWVDQKTEREWKIALWDAFNTLRLADPISVKMVSESFNLADSRKQLVGLLDKLPCMERLNKLKAFW